MRHGLAETVSSLRERRWANLAVVNLRILIGFAFLPAGLKKVLGQPFTDPDNVGVFHEFLHAFLATGPFYRSVGVVQLIACALLMTQRFATVGAVVLLPVLAAITALCWSTAGVPTIVTVTLMLLSTVGLVIWDLPKWRAIFASDQRVTEIRVDPIPAVIDRRLWQRCGLAILAVYAAACAIRGGVYRPRGLELDEPAFYLLPAIAVIPLVTWLIDRSRHRQTRDIVPSEST
jgi:uncharacterized membrane protein YphA (DoxX/SURF4 family)